MTARAVGLTIASVGLLAALPCATPRSFEEATSTVNDAARVGGSAADLPREHKRCDALADNQVSFQEEYALGGTAAVTFVKDNGGLAVAYTDAERAQLANQKDVKFNQDSADYKKAAYVATVGKNLALQSERPDLHWTFGILKNDSQVNAFSAPGGYALITSGALKAVKNEDQLAGVIAHEIGHIVKKHGIAYYNQEKVSVCKSVKTAQAAKEVVQGLFPALYDAEKIIGSYSRLLSAGADALNFDDAANFDFIQMLGEKAGEKIAEGYGHEMELEADQVATELLMSAGYSVEEYAKFVGTLGSSSTHPGGEKRQRAILKHMEKQRTGDDFAGPDGARKPIPLASVK